MSQKISTQISRFGHNAFVAIMIKMTKDEGDPDFEKTLEMSASNQITNLKFIKHCQVELNRFKKYNIYTEHNLEMYYGFKFVRYTSRLINNQLKLFFQERPRWGPKIIYLNTEKRSVYFDDNK